MMTPNPQKHTPYQTSLLLNHIVSTFKAKVGMLWIAETDSFYSTADLRDTDDVRNPNSVLSFLVGYYYNFLKSGNKSGSLVVEDLLHTANIPEHLLKLAEFEQFNAILISPILWNDHVKGTLVLGTDNVDEFDRIDFALLKLLSDVAIKINFVKDDRINVLNTWEKVPNSFGFLVGRSPAMQEIYKTIIKISHSDANIFIFGESGSGKELVARTLYSYSRRKNHAFVPLDCVALPGNLLESELFGYEKGAFTGANTVKQGLLEYADKGTILLDEITEMPIELQAKLLRVLQEGQFRRIGGKDLINVDVRIISASNREPRSAIAKGLLREDLYYRLNVVPLFVPPLRERREDIPLLINRFVKEFLEANDSRPVDLSRDVLQALLNYDFPGNVRELRNLVERLIVLSNGDVVTVDALPKEVREQASQRKAPLREVDSGGNMPLTYSQAKRQSLRNFEREYFTKLLDKFQGNISKVSKEAKVSRKTIYNILKQNGISDKKILGRALW